MALEKANLSSAAEAVGRIPSGVSILTASHNGRTTGMLASWAQQASLDPLMVSVCVKSGRWIETLIDGSGAFVVNLLAQDPKEMFKRFGAGFKPEDDAFAGLEIESSPLGVKLRQAIARIGCRVQTKVTVGDHRLYVGEVVEGDVTDPTARPHVHIRKTGANY